MKRAHLALLLAVAAAACSDAPTQRPLTVGSKNFTESVLLAEILRLEAGRQGLSMQHRRALGGTAILWQALLNGEIDAYPEYTGTLSQELLRDLPPRADLETLRRRLAPLGIGLSAPLGFSDAYALAVRAEVAQSQELVTISDLRAHPGLRFGLSNEFMDRQDGWPGLRAVYDLAPAHLQALDHDLAYRALAEAAVDVVDCYTTDAEIEALHLRVLEDDRGYFPGYQAVVLYRLEAARRAPALRAAIEQLANRIPVAEMRRMNAEVKLAGHEESAVAAAFLAAGDTSASNAGAAPMATGLAARVMQRSLEHLRLVGISLALAIALGLPLGVFAAARPRFGRAALALTSVLQTIPALAMLVFLIPLLGIGARPAIAALFFYSLLPIVRNTIAGLEAIDPGLRDSARALGLPARLRLWRIELPLALGAILAGISTAAVINVGTATLGALIGAGGYGQPILTGVRLNSLALILEGAVPAALLALLVQALFGLLGRALAPSAQPVSARE